MSDVVSPLADDRPNDKGIGYEVKTIAGYYHSTPWSAEDISIYFN